MSNISHATPILRPQTGIGAISHSFLGFAVCKAALLNSKHHRRPLFDLVL